MDEFKASKLKANLAALSLRSLAAEIRSASIDGRNRRAAGSERELASGRLFGDSPARWFGLVCAGSRWLRPLLCPLLCLCLRLRLCVFTVCPAVADENWRPMR